MHIRTVNTGVLDDAHAFDLEHTMTGVLALAPNVHLSLGAAGSSYDSSYAPDGHATVKHGQASCRWHPEVTHTLDLYPCLHLQPASHNFIPTIRPYLIIDFLEQCC